MHPCLWCDITSSQLRLDPSLRANVEERTLATLERDLKHFKTVLNAKLKDAQRANNVIDEPYFNIPLDQVKKQEA